MWPLLRLLGSTVCHQLPDRCLPLSGGPSPFCGRCTGAFSGFLLALLAAAVTGGLRRPGVPGRLPLTVAALALVLNLADGLSAALGQELTGNWSRLALGEALGIGLGFSLTPLLAALGSRRPVAAVTISSVPALAFGLLAAAVVLLAARTTSMGVPLLSLLAALGYLAALASLLFALTTPFRRRRQEPPPSATKK